MEDKPNNIKRRGFASLSPERRKELATKGGQKSGGNFKHDRKRAAELGSLGGKAKWAKNGGNTV